jgi:hypothetical protein
MKLQERSYSSKNYRPKPFVHIEADNSLLVVAISWGEFEHAQSTAEDIAKYLIAARGDVEVTTPFEFMRSLSDQANHARIATLIANESLYRSINKSSYVSGVEVLVLSKKGQQLSWAQVGGPHLLLKRSGRPLIPLAPSYDHAFETLITGELVAPLPSKFLGVDPHCAIHSGDLNISSQDQIVLLASSMIPQELWTQHGLLDLQKITHVLSTADADMPFWLGLVEVG